MISSMTEETQTKGAMDELVKTHANLLDVPPIGTIVNGTILEKTRNSMFIDIGTMGVGVVYGRELFDDMDTFKSAKIGDTIQATIEQLDNEEGYVELSLRSASRERSWQELKHKVESGSAFETEILDANKGGLIVRVNGVTGFLPVSQLAPDHYPRVEGGDKNKILERLKSYVGQQFTVKVITASVDEEKLIVSEKAAVSDEMSDILDTLGKGTVIEGMVSGIVDFGVFIKFEASGKELEGLVHISELAWQRIDNPANFVTIGEKVKAKVIGVDGLRISLSIKQLKTDPWKKVTDKYNLGDKVKGEILKVTPFGAFIKLDEHIHGLAHVSELPDTYQKDPQSFLRVGDTKEFTIISLEPTEHRLGLSMRTSPEIKKEVKKGPKKKLEDISDEELKEKPVKKAARKKAEPKKVVKSKKAKETKKESKE